MKKSQFKQLIKEVIGEVKLNENEEKARKLLQGIVGKTIKDVDYGHWDGTMGITFTDGHYLSIRSNSNDGESWLIVSP